MYHDFDFVEFLSDDNLTIDCFTGKGFYLLLFFKKNVYLSKVKYILTFLNDES